MNIETHLQRILDEDAPYADLESTAYDDTVEILPEEKIEDLISNEGWNSVYGALVSILLNDGARYNDWEISCNVIYASSRKDDRPVDTDLVIGLAYLRLKREDNGAEHNQAWSLACRLKRLDYALSDYDPRKDPQIIAKLNSFGKNLPS